MNIRFLAACLAAVVPLTMACACRDEGDPPVTTTTQTTTTIAETSTSEEPTSTVTTTVTTASTTTAKTTTTKWTTTAAVTTTSAVPTTVTTETTEPTSTTTARRTVASRSKTTTGSTKDWSGVFPVKVEGNAEQRAAAINNNLNGKQKVKIASDRATVALHDHTGYAFNHHPGIGMIDGRLFVSYTQSKRHEDAPGQQIVVSYSDDFFTWSEPVVAGPCLPNTLVEGQVTANVPYSFYAWDGRLYLFFAARSYGPEKFDRQGRFLANADLSGSDRIMLATSDDGIHWSEPMVYGSTMGMPVQSLTGRWVAHAGTGLRWYDSEQENGKLPNSLYWHGYSRLTAEQTQDARERVKKLNGQLSESSMYQTSDYVFHIMTRSEAGYLWHHESLDNGETWEDWYPTNFTSASSMWKFGNLPDGRIYAIGSSDITKGRYPLELWLSKDGVNFDTCYILRDEYDIAETGEIFVEKGINSHCWGWAKGGQYAYPHVVMDDTYLYVTYSRHKEMMEITRVKLSDIL